MFFNDSREYVYGVGSVLSKGEGESCGFPVSIGNFVNRQNILYLTTITKKFSLQVFPSVDFYFSFCLNYGHFAQQSLTWNPTSQGKYRSLMCSNTTPHSY